METSVDWVAVLRSNIQTLVESDNDSANSRNLSDICSRVDRIAKELLQTAGNLINISEELQKQKKQYHQVPQRSYLESDTTVEDSSAGSKPEISLKNHLWALLACLQIEALDMQTENPHDEPANRSHRQQKKRDTISPPPLTPEKLFPTKAQWDDFATFWEGLRSKASAGHPGVYLITLCAESCTRVLQTPTLHTRIHALGMAVEFQSEREAVYNFKPLVKQGVFCYTKRFLEDRKDEESFVIADEVAYIENLNEPTPAYITNLDTSTEAQAKKAHLEGKCAIYDLKSPVFEKLKLRPPVAGCQTPTAFVSLGKGTIFQLHQEDAGFCALNILVEGAPKAWTTIPPYHHQKLEKAVHKALGMAEQPDRQYCEQHLRHQNLYLTNEFLVQNEIDFYQFFQYPGQVVISAPGTYHQGFNCGANICEAINYGDSTWDPAALEPECWHEDGGCGAPRDQALLKFGHFLPAAEPETMDIQRTTSSMASKKRNLHGVGVLFNTREKKARQDKDQTVRSTTSRTQQNQPKRGQPSQTQKKQLESSICNAEALAASFGNPGILANAIHQILVGSRSEQPLPLTTVATDLCTLWTSFNRCDAKTQLSKFTTRVAHENFAWCWYEVQRTHGPKEGRKERMMATTGMAEQEHERARKSAWEGRVWVELCDIFAPELGNDKVIALCAVAGSVDNPCQVSNSTTLYQRLSEEYRKLFIQQVATRKALVLPQLQSAARVVMRALTQSSLPRWRIERTPYRQGELTFGPTLGVNDLTELLSEEL